MEARVETEIDTDVYMGKSQDNRTGFMGIKVLTKVDADMTLEEKQAFLAEIDHRCPVSENLQNTTPVVLELEE